MTKENLTCVYCNKPIRSRGMVIAKRPMHLKCFRAMNRKAEKAAVKAEIMTKGDKPGQA